MVKCKQGNITQLEQRIKEALSFRCTPKNKEFWFGYLSGLEDHQVITLRDYNRVRNNSSIWKCKRRGI